MLPSITAAFIVLVAIYYAYARHQPQFTATASAIWEIWSGNCRLLCRTQSTSSGFGQDQFSNASRAGPSSVCICESCPCSIIENMLSKCRPATNVYTSLVGFIGTSIYNIFKMIVDFYATIIRALECRGSCRQAQIIGDTQYESEDTFTFADEKLVQKTSGMINGGTSGTALKAEQAQEVVTKSKLNEAPGKVFKVKSSSSESDNNEEKSTAVQADVGTTNQGSSSPSDETLNSGVCSKCAEKGKICLVECPRGKKKTK